MFDLQKVGHGHGVQLSQLHHSMANIQICKRLPHIFALALTVSDIKILSFELQNIGQGSGVQFSQLHHSMAMSKSTNVSHIFLR